jgi:hypothetical protein
VNTLFFGLPLHLRHDGMTCLGYRHLQMQS